MRMFKRGLSLLLAVVMVLSLFTVAVSADTGDSAKKPTFTVESPTETYKKGDTFEVAVTLTNLKPFTSLQALIDYDREVLTLDEIKFAPDKWNSYFPAGTSVVPGTKWTTADKETTKNLPEGIQDGVEYGIVTCSIQEPITELNPTYKGVIFKLKFTVKENVTKDSAVIKFIPWIFRNATANVDLESESVDGTVKLEKSAPQTHAITVTTDDNGTASANPTSATADTEITLTAEANNGYEFKSWTTENTDITLKDTSRADSSEHTATFTMPDHAVTVKANFQKINYAITVDSAITNGKLEAPATAQMGDTVTLTPTPAAGYKVASVTANNGSVTVTKETNGTYTFTMPAKDVTVSATFGKQTFAVTLDEGLSGNPTATYGEAYTGTIAPYYPGDEYTYDVTYTVGGSTEQKTATRKGANFTIPGADVTGDLNITLETNLKTVTATLVFGPGSTMKLTTAYGMDVTLPTCEEEGYVYDFTVNGETWTGKNLTEDVIVTVTRVEKQHNVTLGEGLTGAGKATYKTAYTGTINGYNADKYSYTVTYTVNGGTAKTATVDNDGKFTIPAEDVTGALSVHLVAKEKFTVTFKSKDGQTILATEVVLDGAKVTNVPAAPTVDKFAFDKWSDGTNLFTTDEVKDRAVTGNVTYTATYVQAQFDVANNVTGSENLTVPTSAARNTPYTVTIEDYEEGTYTYVLSYSIGNEPKTVSNNGNTFTIPGAEITDDITLLSVAKTAMEHAVDLGASLTGADKATYGTDFTGAIASYEPAKYTYAVKYRVNGGAEQDATISGTGTFTIPGSEITGKVSITLTQTLRKFTVTYTGEYEGSEEVEYGGNATLPTAPTGYDYSFKVGNDSWDGKNITADVTVNVTKTAKQYNVTLDEGLTGADKATHGEDYIVTIDPYDSARYTYVVKYRVNGGAEQIATAYSSGNQFVIFGANVTGDLTLRLVKTGIPYSVTVSCDAAQGTASASPASAEAGTTVTLTATPKPGYTFKEWQSSDVAITDNKFTMPAKNVTVTAVFERVYTVTFHTGGGSYVAPQTLTANEKVTKPVTDPTRTGYTFAGWYADSTCKTPYTFGNTVSADTTVYAGWRAHTYTVVFDKNDRDATGTMSDQNFLYDMTARLSSCNFELKDHVFSGWALTANGRAVYADRESVRNLTDVDGAVITLYAVWTDDLPWLLPSDDDWSDASRRFDDVSRNAWYRDAVDFVVGNDLMNGVSNNLFAPNDTMTRAMVVTVLYRLEGEPYTYGSTRFTDVVSGSWYADAVAWASENGIVKGTSDTTFSPKQDVTREQLAAILYRYSEYCGYRTSGGMSIAGFSDADEVSAYARDAVRWAYGIGLIEGRTAATLAPKGTATRAEVATILMRYCKYVMR